MSVRMDASLAFSVCVVCVSVCLSVYVFGSVSESTYMNGQQASKWDLPTAFVPSDRLRDVLRKLAISSHQVGSYS